MRASFRVSLLFLGGFYLCRRLFVPFRMTVDSALSPLVNEDKLRKERNTYYKCLKYYQLELRYYSYGENIPTHRMYTEELTQVSFITTEKRTEVLAYRCIDGYELSVVNDRLTIGGYQSTHLLHLLHPLYASRALSSFHHVQLSQHRQLTFLPFCTISSYSSGRQNS